MTAREKIRDIAAAHGWNIDQPYGSEATDLFAKSGRGLSVRYSVRGGIVVAGLKEPGARYYTEISGSGKAAQVESILKEN